MSEKDLRRLMKSWRDYADGHYCQTYNLGMGEGLRRAAEELEEELENEIEKSAQQAGVADESNQSAESKVSPRG